MYKARIKNNICTNAHPVGCFYNVHRQMQEAVTEKMTGLENKTALIVGCSSGIGLASRAALTFAGGMDTLGVYFDRAAQPHKYGTAGWYQNQALEYYARRSGKMALSTNQDAFQSNAKDWVIQKLQQQDKKIDVLVYSLASPKRKIKGLEEYRSTIKPIGEAYKGRTLDVFKGELRDLEIESATPDEVEATIKVMGGEDWQEWVLRLKKAGVLAENFKTVAYSYLGSENTQEIYGNGTLGRAKAHLHETAIALEPVLKDINGQACIGLLQALVTPSSSVIPSMPLYLSILHQEQKAQNKYESTLQQVLRLFKDNWFHGELFNAMQGSSHYLRVDDLERSDSIQESVSKIFSQLKQDNLAELVDIEKFKTGFLQQFGFSYDFINYEQKPDPLTPPALHDFDSIDLAVAG